MTDDVYRRLVGGLLGVSLGLAYGLVSNLINWITMPGIPYYAPPFGTMGNLAAGMAWGAALGLLVTWPDSTVLGVALASAASALMFVGRTMGLVGGSFTSSMAVTAIVLFIPMIIANAPAMAILRWAIDKQVEKQHPARSRVPLAQAPLLLVGVMLIAGAFSYLGAEARHDLARMNTLVQAGLSGGGSTGLPASLQAAEVGGFLQYAQGSYVLEWTDRNIDRFRIPRPATNFNTQTVVTARFENGWTLACLFASEDETPICRGY